MAKKPPYRVLYAPEAIEHLKHLEATQRSAVIAGVDEQLLHEPTLPTRNRAPMRSNALAAYRLRIGDLRVYYELLEDAERVVLIKAIGLKSRDKVLVGGLEIKL